MWKLEDFTGTGKGYMRITKDGRRVADVFPFAANQDAEWTVKAAQELVDVMNERQEQAANQTMLMPDMDAKIEDCGQ